MSFETVLARADRQVERVFGETEGFAFVPMREVVNATPMPDEEREGAAFVATFDERAQKFDDAGAGKRVAAQPRITYTEGPSMRRLDRVVRVRTGMTYEVATVMPDGLGRVLVVLVEVSA